MGVDYNVQTVIRDSKGAGLYNKVLGLRAAKKNLEEQLEDAVEQLLDVVESEGTVIAYKDGEPMPYILNVSRGTRSVLDKETLAADLGVAQSDLNAEGYVELGNENKLTPERLKEYKHEEITRKLSARKAKKSELQIIYSRGTGK